MKEYIEREAALLEIEEWADTFCECDYVWPHVIESIRKLHAADVRPVEWIPVTERLPEDVSDILAVQSYCGEVRIIPANYDRGVWYDCVFNRVAEHITHWMPLPPAPKEET